LARQLFGRADVGKAAVSQIAVGQQVPGNATVDRAAEAIAARNGVRLSCGELKGGWTAENTLGCPPNISVNLMEFCYPWD
jgi:hypothetical protein